jgi:hypothetical protein
MNRLDEEGQFSLDREAEEVARFCETYSYDCESEVIRDLTNNAGSSAKAEYKDPEDLANLIEGMELHISVPKSKVVRRTGSWFLQKWQNCFAHLSANGPTVHTVGC